MKRFIIFCSVLIGCCALIATWYIQDKLPQRSGNMQLAELTAPVDVHYDERGVPHIQAQNELDAYRALGYVQAQDRLFQMEIMRRLARGELSEILGEKTVKLDRLFRTLRLYEHAQQYVQTIDQSTAPAQALQAYLDGVNQFQAQGAKPVEFDLLAINPRPYTMEDTISIAGYLAYSFAAAFRTEPTLSYIRQQLGADYLAIFDLELPSTGALANTAQPSLSTDDWSLLHSVAQLSQEALFAAGLPQFEGSNAWVLDGSKTASGKPLLAGDPHISFSVPAVWYEAHLQTPDFELYGHFQALNPFALLGHNQEFGWTVTMFQNDDLDLIALKSNPEDPEQVWHNNEWQTLNKQTQWIVVKDQDPQQLILHDSAYGPIINDILSEHSSDTPIAMWWSFLETENPILEAFYELNRANTLDKARQASSKIHAPGLNIVWANAQGDIAWWAAAKMPIRDKSAQPSFILDSHSASSKKYGFYPFSDNPQEENPARGYIVSANFLPPSPNKVPLPGYYNLADRGAQLLEQLSQPDVQWDTQNSQAVQLGIRTGYAQRLLSPLLEDLKAIARGNEEKKLIKQLSEWQGDYPVDSYLPSLFTEFTQQLLQAAMLDELGDEVFANLLRTRIIDSALPLLAADPQSPWWHNHANGEQQTRQQVVAQAWQAALWHLRTTFGSDPNDWLWGTTHTLTHKHPLGEQSPLDSILNIGSFAAPGGHEMPNNFSSGYSSAPWAVEYGPSTRRIIDFAAADKSLGINPLGQSGVRFDKHYADQAHAYMQGQYFQQHLADKDIKEHTQSTLRLLPQ
ncbi:penicillin acylase family protein [Pseudomonas sp. C27(2019)]|uniref:penicillin acylase family protein n=1 Tax=Pseudomonas sp. C27(2019) TaxID=2604941 RepID=UPI00124723A5|nr:penicillin acylase family protein [Pseudomonas sp. C27(2019)]QEY57930.1 penicillin acylase family protein [Pseudomonas sp. C27(2019)]